MSEVKLDANGLIANTVVSSEIETQTLKLGDGVLSEDPSGSLAWNGENFLTDSSRGYSHFVGEQWISFDGTIPLGGIPFDGRSVEKALYPDLVKWIQDNNRAITLELYQSMLSSNNSNVPYYVIEDTNIILPIFRGYLYFNDNKEAGTYIKEGLPNIKGTLHPLTSDNEAYFHTSSTTSGAFYKISTGSNNTTVQNTGGTYPGFALGFDASKSNSIYGNSSNVTPHTTCVLIGVYAFNTISNQSNIDLETFRQTMATGLNEGIIPCFPVSTIVPQYTNKLCIQDASKDNAPNNGVILSTYTNANYNGQLFIGDNASQGLYIRGLSNGVQGDWKRVMHLEKSWTSGTSWYRKYSDGWIEQGGVINYGSGTTKWNKSVSLNTSFTSTNYNVVASFYDGDPAGDHYHQNGINIISRTTSSFQVYQCGSDAIQYITWYACGY